VKERRQASKVEGRHASDASATARPSQAKHACTPKGPELAAWSLPHRGLDTQRAGTHHVGGSTEKRSAVVSSAVCPGPTDAHVDRAELEQARCQGEGHGRGAAWCERLDVWGGCERPQQRQEVRQARVMAGKFVRRDAGDPPAGNALATERSRTWWASKLAVPRGAAEHVFGVLAAYPAPPAFPDPAFPRPTGFSAFPQPPPSWRNHRPDAAPTHPG
jgi:hypothetical protein